MSNFRSRLLIVGGNDRSLWANRGDLMRELLDRGWTLRVVLPPPEPSAPTPWFDVPIRRIPLQRTGTNPLSDMAALRALRKEIRNFEPDVVFAYNPKPVVLSGIALKRNLTVRLVLMITGLGALAGWSRMKGRMAAHALGILYSSGLPRADVILFQNDDDREFFESRWHQVKHTRVDLVPGSGINLRRFPRSEPPEGPPRFLLLTRVLVNKGVREFVAASRQVVANHPECQFRVVGGHDPHLPHSIPRHEWERWKRESIVEFVGRVDDVRPHLAWCSVLCHPSYYGEGTPRSILEALSTGRPVITTDAPGCRHTVEEGVSGFVIQAGRVEPLAERMKWFAQNPAKIFTMGNAARKRARTVYDVNAVNEQIIGHLEVPSREK